MDEALPTMLFGVIPLVLNREIPADVIQFKQPDRIDSFSFDERGQIVEHHVAVFDDSDPAFALPNPPSNPQG